MNKKKRDYYDVLGVQRSADAKAIKTAYRKLAMQHHPDRNKADPEAEKKFKEIREAYDVLGDEQKRSTYDRVGHAGESNNYAGQSPGGGFNAGGFEFDSSFFTDIFGAEFGSFFGGQSKRSRGPSRGGDLRYDLTISLEDVFNGKKVAIKFNAPTLCSNCNGSGAQGGSQSVAMCGTCHGSGRAKMQQGVFIVETTCGRCGGSGRLIKDPCRMCHGRGRMERERNVRVEIPSGIGNEHQIKVSSEGEGGYHGGPSGDLYVVVKVADHQFFRRDNDDLCCDIPVKMTDAILGGEVEVPGIDGSAITVAIPSETQTGDKIRIRSAGMKAMRSNRRGDLYALVNVELPSILTKRQKELLKQFAEEGVDVAGSHPKCDGFIKKVYNFFSSSGARGSKGSW